MSADWSLDEDQRLEQAVQGVPPGSTDRWNKIAQLVGKKAALGPDCKARWEKVSRRKGSNGNSNGGCQGGSKGGGKGRKAETGAAPESTDTRPPPLKCTSCNRAKPSCGFAINSRTCVDCKRTQQDPNSTRNKRRRGKKEAEKKAKAAVKAESLKEKRYCSYAKHWVDKADINEGSKCCQSCQTNAINNHKKTKRAPKSKSEISRSKKKSPEVVLPLPLPSQPDAQRNNTASARSASALPQSSMTQQVHHTQQVVLPQSNSSLAAPHIQHHITTTPTGVIENTAPADVTENTASAFGLGQHEMPKQQQHEMLVDDAFDPDTLFGSEDDAEPTSVRRVNRVNCVRRVKHPADWYDGRSAGRQLAGSGGTPVHHGVVCDVTGMDPIIGARYKKLNQNYDLCQEVFDELSDEEAQEFVRIETPAQASEMGFGASCEPAFVGFVGSITEAGPLATAGPELLATGSGGPLYPQDEPISAGIDDPVTTMEETPRGTGEQQDDSVDAVSDGIQKLDLNTFSGPMTPMDEADTVHIQQMMDQMQLTTDADSATVPPPAAVSNVLRSPVLYCQRDTPEAIKMVSEAEFERLVELKHAANNLFSKHKFSEAAAIYQTALDIFDNSHNTENQIRIHWLAAKTEKVKICSNLAQCNIYLKHWHTAIEAAAAGLQVCSTITVEPVLEEKLRYRRARATRDGLPKTAAYLRAAMQDCRWLIKERSQLVEVKAILQQLETSAKRLDKLRTLQQSLQVDRSAVARAAACGAYTVLVKTPSGTEFIKTKVPHDHRSLLPGSKIRVKWYSPDCNLDKVSHSKFQNDQLSGVAGTQEFDYYDPATMAIELQCISTGTVDDFRTFDGGLLYLMGDTEYFWNAILHYASHKSCAPPFSKSKKAPITDWSQIVLYQEIDQLISDSKEYGRRTRRVESRLMGVTLTIQSRGQDGMRRYPWLLGLGIGDDDKLPTTKDDLPIWWTEAIRPWDRMLGRMFEASGAPHGLPCMFFATSAAPDGAGCAAAEGCAMCHDEWWLTQAKDFRAHPRMCVCGNYSGVACIGCRKVYLCGECPTTLGNRCCQQCTKDGADLQTLYNPLLDTTGIGSHRFSGKAQPTALAPDVRASMHTFDSCGYCGASEGPFQKCGKCKNTLYCSRACQKKDFPMHKRACKQLRSQRKEYHADGPEGPRLKSEATGIGLVGIMQDGSTGQSGISFGSDSSSEPLMFASVSELPMELQFLVSCGPMPNLGLVRQLLPVLCREHDILELRVPSAGFTALEWAAKTGNFDIAQFLANQNDSCGLVHIGSPVAWACYTSRVKLAQMLVDLGADSAATDDVFWNCTPPMMAAAENHQLESLKWLVHSQGHDINMTHHGDGILAAIGRPESGNFFSAEFLDEMRQKTGDAFVDQIKSKNDPMAVKSDALKSCTLWARQNGALEQPQMDVETNEENKRFQKVGPDMDSEPVEALVAAQVLNPNDPTLLTWAEIKASWGSCVSFFLSYGLKPYKPDDWDEAVAISRALKSANDGRELAGASGELQETKVPAMYLNDMVALKLFQHLDLVDLPRVQMVCRKWEKQVHGIRLIRVEFDTKAYGHKLFEYILGNFPAIVTLEIEIDQEHMMDYDTGICRSMTMAFITAQLTSFFEECPPLTALSIRFPDCCEESVEEIMTSQTLRAISRHPLQHLEMPYLTIDHVQLRQLLQTPVLQQTLRTLDLVSINFSNYSRITDVMDDISQLTELRILGLGAWTCMHDGCHMLDEHVIKAVESLVQLRILRIHGLPGGGELTDRCLKEIAHSCPNLQLLDCSFNEGCTFYGVLELVKYCALRELDLSDTGVPVHMLKELCTASEESHLESSRLNLVRFTSSMNPDGPLHPSLRAAIREHPETLFVGSFTGLVQPMASYFGNPELLLSRTRFSKALRAVRDLSSKMDQHRHKCFDRSLPAWAENEWE